MRTEEFRVARDVFIGKLISPGLSVCCIASAASWTRLSSPRPIFPLDMLIHGVIEIIFEFYFETWNQISLP
jgi:hypothetical protein